MDKIKKKFDEIIKDGYSESFYPEYSVYFSDDSVVNTCNHYLLKQLQEFAKWVGENNFKYDGVHIWKRRVASPIGGVKSIYYNTEQLIEQFLKEVK